MPLVLEDILRTDGQDNDGGLLVFAYWAPYQDVLTFPKVVADPGTFAARVTVTGNFVMKPGKQFFQFQSTLLTPFLDTDGVGERDGKSAENKLTLKRAGNQKEVLGFIEFAKNTDMVLVIKQINGNARILGSEGLPASLEKFEVKSGAAVKDSVHAMLEFLSVGRIAPFYTGEIPLTPAA